MVKMALSAMIKQVMPTAPLDGIHPASGSREVAAGAAFMGCSFWSFVFPVGVGWVFEVPKWAPASDHWDLSEIVLWRRRRSCPLKSPRIPRVVPGRLSFAQGADDIENENQQACRLKDRAHGANHI